MAWLPLLAFFLAGASSFKLQSNSSALFEGSATPWELVLKVAETDKLGFSSALWTSSDLLNQDSPWEKEEDAKYDAYNKVPFKKIRMCVGTPQSNCVEHVFAKKYPSAKALFSAGYIRDETVNQDGILKAFGPKKGKYRDCAMQRPGFNIQCKDGNKARWGYCNNCASQKCQISDSNDADAAIGIGLAGQSTDTELGGGWTAYFASGEGTCSANSKTFKAVWLWVASLEGSSRPYTRNVRHWTPVMKIAQTKTFGFSSSYWGNNKLLNPDSALAVDEDAKYQAFLDKPLDAIRMCVDKPEENCVIHKFKDKYDSAKALFTAGYIKDTTVDQKGILSAFGPKPGSYQNCGMQRPGFNIECKDGNKARWGYCNNCASQGCQEDDSNDADSAIGIGLAGQSSTEVGGGWTEYFASGHGTCSANSKTFKSVWLWVSSGSTASQAQDLALSADFSKVAADEAKFLSECSAALAPAECVEVAPRSLRTVVTVTAPTLPRLERASSQVFNAGLDLPTIGRLRPLLTECEGTLATGDNARHWACDGQPLEKCDATYTKTPSGQYYQCGVSGENCLGTGPKCLDPGR